MVIFQLNLSKFTCQDFDGDGYLDKQDLLETIKLLCGEDELKTNEMELVSDKILEEVGFIILSCSHRSFLLHIIPRLESLFLFVVHVALVVHVA